MVVKILKAREIFSLENLEGIRKARDDNRMNNQSIMIPLCVISVSVDILVSVLWVRDYVSYVSNPIILPVSVQ